MKLSKDTGLLIALIFGILITFFAPLIFGHMGYPSKGFIAVILIVVTYWASFIHIVKNYMKKKGANFKNSIYSNVINLLRGMKHDYVNNLQVIYSLVQLNKLDKLQDHLDKLNIESEKLGKIIKIKHPELAMFFLEQLSSYKKKEINYNIEVHTAMESIGKSPREMIFILKELCRLVGLDKKEGFPLSVEWKLFGDDKFYIVSLNLKDSKKPWNNNLETNLETNIVDKLQNKIYDIKIEESEGENLAAKLYIEKAA